MKKMTFEQAMKRLEEITSAMDNMQTGLEDSLSLFTEGTQLIDFCNKKLNEASLKIENFKGDKADEL